MRNVTFGAACSLDGYIARADDGVDWLYMSDDVKAIMVAYWQGIDTVVMGRKTYEVAVRSGKSAYAGVANYVCTRNPDYTAAGKVEIVSSDATAFLERLKRAEGGGICVLGGGDLARSFFDADLIDEVGLNVHPTLLGSGVPLFHALPRQVDLELIEARRLAGGCVMLSYRVKRDVERPR